MMRAYSGHNTSTIASNAFLRPGPSAVVIAIARINDGNASIASQTRMMTSSVRPPA